MATSTPPVGHAIREAQRMEQSLRTASLELYSDEQLVTELESWDEAVLKPFLCSGLFIDRPKVAATLLLEGIISWDWADSVMYNFVVREESYEQFLDILVSKVPASALLEIAGTPYYELLDRLPAEFVLTAYATDSVTYSQLRELVTVMQAVVSGENEYLSPLTGMKCQVAFSVDDLQHVLDKFPLVFSSSLFSYDELATMLFYLMNQDAKFALSESLLMNESLCVPFMAASYRFLEGLPDDVIVSPSQFSEVAWDNKQYSFEVLNDAYSYARLAGFRVFPSPVLQRRLPEVNVKQLPAPLGPITPYVATSLTPWVKMSHYLPAKS